MRSVRVLARWDRVGQLDDPTGYLYRTAMNAFRRAHRRAELAARRALCVTAPDDGIAEIDAADATMRALAPLSPRQRAAIVLVDLLDIRPKKLPRSLG